MALESDLDVAAVGVGILRRIFSTKVLRDLAQFGTSPVLESVVRMLQRRGQPVDRVSLGEIYEASYFECARSERIEYVYKNALVEKKVLGRHSLRTASAMFEVSVGSSKLDALLLTTSASAYEIKTERDELGKLASQIADYQRAFPKVWVFTCEKHLGAVERQVPMDVGISILGKRYRIQVVREAQAFTALLDVPAMLRLLRKRELLDLIGEKGNDLPNTRVFSEALKIAYLGSVEELNQHILAILRGRALSNTPLAEKLPRSLAALALALSLNDAQTSRLICALKSPAARIV